MKYKELINQPEAELRKMILDLRVQAHELSVKLKLNQEKQTHKLRQIKKDIARILTFLQIKVKK